MNIRNLKNGRSFWLALVVTTGFVYLSSFSMISPDSSIADRVTAGPEQWEGYKNWTKITKEPNTGDPTGFLSKKHGGTKAYRDIFVNAVGAEAYQNQKFPLPEGTVVVKEAFKNEAAWKSQSKPELTVMVKQATGSNPDTGDWKWYMGASGSDKMSGTGMDTKWGKFCGSCHAYGQQADYTFMSTLGK
jgi:Cytochrome P460